MKILLFGKTGQVGKEIVHLCHEQKVNLFCVDRSSVDLTNPAQINDSLNLYRPDIIINAAAYTSVDLAETNCDAAYAINQVAVKYMAEFAKKTDAFLIHYSTDYVYDGNKESPYLEEDETHPINIYGKSKLAGEQEIIKSGCKFIILRTTWIYSKFGNNFIKTILSLAKTNPEINVVYDQIGVPTSANFIARETLKIIEMYTINKVIFGVYHLTPKGETSWYKIACEIIEFALKYNYPILTQKNGIRPVTSKTYKTVAKRPKNSVLETTLYSKHFNSSPPFWTADFYKTLEFLLDPAVKPRDDTTGSHVKPRDDTTGSVG